MEKETILVTGAAGFIGYAIVLKLLSRGEKVIGVDNLNDYYDVDLKKCRLNIISNFSKKIIVVGIFIKYPWKMNHL